MSKPSLSVLKHVVDAHCHPTESAIPSDVMDNLPITLCAMSSHQHDQELVAQLASKHPDKVAPCFGYVGYHPWYMHWISIANGPPPPKDTHYRSLFIPIDCAETDKASLLKRSEQLDKMLPLLPDPVSLEDCLNNIRINFKSFPKAMLGEVGLDRIVRVPCGSDNGRRKLSPFTIPLEHQLHIVEAQLELAVEYKRSVSFHSVKSQKATIELFDRLKRKHGNKWEQINVNIHSCSVSPETWKAIEGSHKNVFLSCSTVINGRSSNHRKLISAASSDRLLVESDFNDVRQCASRTWDMLQTVAEVKGWVVEDEWIENDEIEPMGTVRRLERNWKRYIEGIAEE